MRLWAEDDLPSEKLLMKGSGSLSDAELLSIIIGSGFQAKIHLRLHGTCFPAVETVFASSGRLAFPTCRRSKASVRKGL